MEYQSTELVIGLNQVKRKFTINFFFSTFVYTAGSFLLYAGKKDFNIVFIVTESLLWAAFAITQYAQIVMPGLVANRTAIKVVIDRENITVETAPFNVLFLIDKPSEVLSFSKNTARISRIPYQLKQLYNSNGVVFNISDDTRSVFIICDYFDQSLQEELREIKSGKK